ncbi:hypothetical protein Tco_1098813 [Tanacetum coccineum]
MDKNNMHISHDLKSKPLHTKLKYLKSHLKLWYAHTKEVRANRKNCILATLRDLDKKIDEGHDTDVDRTTRINRMQELEDLEKLESMDLSRTINVGRTKAEFDALIFDIASLELEEIYDSLLFGISFVFGQFLCSLRFPYVASWIFRFSHGTPQRKRRNALTPSLLLPVRPYGGLEIISLSTLIL